MPTANIQWYNLNSQRNYPLEDSASRIDKEGNYMPVDILTDLKLWIPGSINQSVYISSCIVTSNLVSITLSLDDSSKTPLAALTTQRPVDVYRNYTLEPFKDGVYGWAVFGPGSQQGTGVWKFSNPSSSKLLSKTITGYDAEGVSSVAKYEQTAQLDGLVKIISDSNDLVVKKGTRNIDGSDKDALVVGLNKLDFGNEIFERFLGPCDKNPDSGTCRLPVISAINDVIPDCNGAITIKITEISDTGNLLSLTKDPDNNHTIFLNYDLGISQICDEFSEDIPEISNECDSDESNPGYYDTGPFA